MRQTTNEGKKKSIRSSKDRITSFRTKFFIFVWRRWEFRAAEKKNNNHIQNSIPNDSDDDVDGDIFHTKLTKNENETNRKKKEIENDRKIVPSRFCGHVRVRRVQVRVNRLQWQHKNCSMCAHCSLFMHCSAGGHGPMCIGCAGARGECVCVGSPRGVPVP